jgi:hypothetical protein
MPARSRHGPPAVVTARSVASRWCSSVSCRSDSLTRSSSPAGPEMLPGAVRARPTTTQWTSASGSRKALAFGAFGRISVASYLLPLGADIGGRRRCGLGCDRRCSARATASSHLTAGPALGDVHAASAPAARTSSKRDLSIVPDHKKSTKPPSHSLHSHSASPDRVVFLVMNALVEGLTSSSIDRRTACRHGNGSAGMSSTDHTRAPIVLRRTRETVG